MSDRRTKSAKQVVSMVKKREALNRHSDIDSVRVYQIFKFKEFIFPSFGRYTCELLVDNKLFYSMPFFIGDADG